MGKTKRNGGKGHRFFRWIRSDLPDEEDKKSPVLLLGVSKISDSPSTRRRSVDQPTGSIKFFRPPKSKYTRGLQGDDRLQKIRQDLLIHKQNPDTYIPSCSSQDGSVEPEGRCLKLNCTGSCICKKKDSSNRGSFSFHVPQRHSSLCPSESYGKPETKDLSENDIEFKYTEHVQDCQPGSSKQHSYNVTPKSVDRRNFSLSNFNERFRKTLSLDSRKIDTGRTPLSLPKEQRPKSLVHTSNIIVKNDDSNLYLNQNFEKTAQPKKKRKSFFSLDTFFDSKKSDSSSTDDYCSSKYKRFELESDDSPIFRRDDRAPEKTPDLLNLPVIIDSVRKKQSDTRRQLEKLESHYFKTSKIVIDAVPKDAKETGHTNRVYQDDDDVEYIEPIGQTSTFTSQSTLILEKNIPEKPDSILTIFTDETDIPLPSSTVSPKSDGRTPENDLDSIGAYEIEVKESDILKASKDLTVKVMDKSVDSIGSCSLDVDASTDFSEISVGAGEAAGEHSLQQPHLSCAETARSIHTLLTPINSAEIVPTPCQILKIMLYGFRSYKGTLMRLLESTCSLESSLLVLHNDTTSGSLNLLTPSSTTSRVRDFTNRIQERAAATPVITPTPTPTPKELPLIKEHEGASDVQPAKNSVRINQSPYVKEKSAKNNFLALDPPGLRRKEKEVQRRAEDERRTSLLKPPSKVYDSSNRSRHRDAEPLPAAHAPSYLQLACSVNGYTRLTAYDSALRRELARSREASPQRWSRQDHGCLLVPVPVGSKLLIGRSPGNERVEPAVRAQTEPSLSMADQRSHFLDSQDQTDNAQFKSSYSENNFKKPITNGKDQKFADSFTITTNGVSKRVEISKENGERLGSPMKSFIQQRVERLYGPGALAQGFLMQRHRNNTDEEKVLTEKSFNYQNNVSPNKHDAVGQNGASEDVSLPVLRHLRPEFRAQLPILSPKKNKTDVSPQKDIPNKTDLSTVSNGVKSSDCDVKSVNVGDVLNGVAVLKLGKEGSERDGHYFLALESKETERLLGLAAAAEKELESLQSAEGEGIEEARGLIRAAAGKARLLATQKMQQFKGLCYANIEGSGSGFPTTVEDLQGFWDMVQLQVKHVDTQHAHLAAMKANGWKEMSPELSVSSRPASTTPRRRAPPANNEKARAQAQRREAERKAMLEQRRRMAREKQLAARTSAPLAGCSHTSSRAMAVEGSQEVEIFVSKSGKPSAPRGDTASLNPSSAADSVDDADS